MVGAMILRYRLAGSTDPKAGRTRWFGRSRLRLRRRSLRHLPLVRWKSQDSLDNTMADRETGRLALEALDQVPPLYHEVLELYFLQDLSYETIAKMLHIPLGTVMSRLYKARKLMRDAWRNRHKRVTAAK